MWLTDLVVLATEAPPPAEPPAIPYDTIGLVLVAIVGAISAIIVAVIQRGNKTAPAPTSASPPVPTGGFTLSETEWITVRDKATRLEAAFEHLQSDLDHIKRELGIR